ncbi:MAG: disulfide bond formation protein B [Rhodobacteraceae bacterium]|nr:disulfide bond formation protein B [Paracoccaceae bacterium]
MSARAYVLLAAGGSAALLLGALGFQYLGGYPPCPICIWQRWPHLLAVLIGVLALWQPAPLVIGLGALCALATSAIGVYHTGIERSWWPGPDSCTGGGPDLGGLSGADLLSTKDVPRLVMCDQVAWQFAGLSMASWNAVFSALLVALWVAAYLKARNMR